MLEVLWWLAALLLCTAGMAWLALAMDVHWQQVMNTDAEPSAPTQWRLRALGGLSLLAALPACLKADNPDLAVLVWFMLLTTAAVAVGLTLTWRPQWLRWLAGGAGRWNAK